MDKNKKIALLQQKIDFINDLKKEVNYESLRQWREETLMVLDNLISEDSKYYKNFEKISFKSSVMVMGEPEENERMNADFYMKGLENALASLKAIKFGLENDLT